MNMFQDLFGILIIEFILRNLKNIILFRGLLILFNIQHIATKHVLL